LVKFFGIEISGNGNLDGSTANLILANHISYLDVIVLNAQFGCAFLAKNDVENWPLIGNIGKKLGCVFVNRKCILSKAAALKKISNNLILNKTLCVFPEGTTSHRIFPAKSDFKSGIVWSALQASKNIVCIGISYDDQKEVSWTENQTFVPNLFRFLRRKSTKVSLRIKTLTTNDYFQTASKLNSQILGEHVFQSIQTLCLEAGNEIRRLNLKSQELSSSQCIKSLIS
jgi:1-acyl-sn-glycerol-3-phosphate acyltransferase